VKTSIGWPAQPSEPLKCRIFENNGKPIKTVAAAKEPFLTRRERRAMVREAQRNA
jgi:hypothetical protein